MVPEKLQLRNFMAYGEDAPPLLFAGLHVACISGNNGAGKSSLLDAFTWALWGKARAKSDDDLIKLGRDEMDVALEFRLDDQHYRVIRRRKRGKRVGTTTLDFQVRDADGSWRRLTADTLTETQALINRTLRIEYETFINSAFLLQGRADEFTGRKPAERKQVLADILGFSEYEELEARAKEEVQRIGKDFDLAQAMIERLQVIALQHDELEQRVADARLRVATAQDTLEEAEERVGGLREHAAQFREISAQRDALIQALQQQEQRRRDLDEQQIDLRARLTAIEATVARRVEIEQGYADLQSARDELRIMDRRRDEAHELGQQIKDLKAQLEGMRYQIDTDLRAVVERLAELDQQNERRRRTQRDHDRLARELADLSIAPDDLTDLRAEERRLLDRQDQLQDLRIRAQQLQAVIDRERAALDAQRQQYDREMRELETRSSQLPAIERQFREADADIARFQALDQDLAERRLNLANTMQRRGELDSDYATITRQGKELNEKLRLIEHGEGRCPVCNSELGADGAAHIMATYTDERADLRRRAGEIKREIGECAAFTDDLLATIAVMEQDLAGWAAAEALRGRLEQQRTQAQHDRERLAALRVEAQAIDAQMSRRDYAHAEQRDLAQIEAAAAVIGDLEALRGALAEIRASLDAAEQRAAQARQLQQQIDRLDAELGALSDLDARRAPLAARHDELRGALEYETFGADLRQQIEAAMVAGKAIGYDRERHMALRDHVDQLQAWERDLLQLERDLADLDPLRRQLAAIRKRLSDVDAAIEQQQQQRAALDLQLADQPQVDQALRAAEVRLLDLRKDFQAADRVLVSAEAELKACRQAVSDLADQRRHAAMLADERSIYEELAQAFGKKGIQAMLIETAIPEIEVTANDLLARMTDNQMHLSFETQRDTKRGDSTIETLDIRISDTLGTRDYQLYSGGEAFRVDFAVRIALSKLLARRAGASLKTLVIDEGFGSQDGRGRDRIVEAINSIESEFDLILVITHIDELKDQFQSRIEITKEPEGSTWLVV